MATKKKLLQAAAGGAGGEVLGIENVFSIDTWEGSGSSRSITNNIDLSGSGGLTWLKSRTGTAYSHYLFDTERGASQILSSNTTGGSVNNGTTQTSFNSDGFSLGTNVGVNGTGNFYVGWTFRKAPKFFDVVTWTGDGVFPRQISHNLGSTPGAVLVKCTSSSSQWLMGHRSYASQVFQLNTSLAGVSTYSKGYLHASEFTDTTFTVRDATNGNDVNASGRTYVAYVFAHNNGDGTFGVDGDLDVIKCVNWTGNGSSTGPTINLGFEPEFLLFKSRNVSGHWFIHDSTRGMPHDGHLADSYYNSFQLRAELSDNELSGPTGININATGFSIDTTNSDVNGNGVDYICIAVRKGLLGEITSSSQVFDVDKDKVAGMPGFISSTGLVDFAIRKNDYSVAGAKYYDTRLLGETTFVADSANDEQYSPNKWEHSTGYNYGTGTTAISDYATWKWRRARGYFDVVAYKGDGTAPLAINHSLGVVPEMMWVKSRDTNSRNFFVYHKDFDSTAPEDKYAVLNTDAAVLDNNQPWFDTAPTSTTFSVGNFAHTGANNLRYVAYLFATLAGISKVGSFTGNGSSQNIDCGFTNGAKFVLIKGTGSVQNWVFFDTERGILIGNDDHLALNNQDGSVYENQIHPHSSGFTIEFDSSANTGYRMNVNTVDYIFYAIAT